MEEGVESEEENCRLDVRVRCVTLFYRLEFFSKIFLVEISMTFIFKFFRVTRVLLFYYWMRIGGSRNRRNFNFYNCFEMLVDFILFRWKACLVSGDFIGKSLDLERIGRGDNVTARRAIN